MLEHGQVLYGYCGGYFGRESYAIKYVEAIGQDWVVARDKNGEVHFACGKDIHKTLISYTKP